MHYLLRTRKVVPDREAVSPRMLYDMARRYDEWPGENYDGSSARGAMKGWHKHGVCSRGALALQGTRKQANVHGPRFDGRAAPAAGRLLARQSQGHRRDALRDQRGRHSATRRAGAQRLGSGRHRWNHHRTTATSMSSAAMPLPSWPTTSEGFWIQNSWGDDWGREGFARVSYDDWLANGTDVWVARLGAPIELRSKRVGVARRGRGGGGIAQLRVLRAAPAHHQSR